MTNSNSIYENGTYLDHNKNWHLDDSPWKAEQIRQLLVRNKVSLDSIAEIGCGAGGVLRNLSDSLGNDKVYVGYDISPQAIELACNIPKQNITYHIGDMLELEVYFDVVMAIDVFEHVENYIGFLRRLRTKGQYKVFHIPLDLSVQSVLRNSPILAGREWLGHLHYFTKDTALATLRDIGYEVVHWSYTKWCFELPDRRLESRLLWLPRRVLYGIHRDFAVQLLGGFSLLVLAK